MTETKTSAPGVDWTKLLTDPDIISHLAELLQAYRDAEPARRDQVLRDTMRKIKSETAKAQLDWTPILRQPDRAQFSGKGELCHGIVTQEVHSGVQGSRRAAARVGGLGRGSGAGL